jgi:ornithine--oxo-acid transaminase
MGFDLRALLAERRGDGPGLHARYLNRQVPRLLRSTGFDRVYERAEGAWLFDRDGARYLDFLSGFGVFAVGRNHPVVRRALQDVLDEDLADLVQFDCPLLAGLLAEQLLARAPGLDRVYFANSGAEAVETALKFARRATGRNRVLYCRHAYHGVTTGALAVNGGRDFRRGFGPLPGGREIPFGDLDALSRELRRGGVAALIVEPIQGKGVHLLPRGYLAAAADLLHERGALLICDEVQTGVGRTGRFFAYQHDDVVPDIVTVAKALSGGYVPVGATLTTNAVFERVYGSLDRVFVHASTFAGNALAMAAGLATLSVLDDERLVDNAAATGGQLLAALRPMVDRYELVADVRGRGLMVGIEFGRPRTRSLRATWSAMQLLRRGLFAQIIVMPLFARHGILTQVAADHMDVIKLLPPLTIGAAEVDAFVDAFTSVMADAHRGNGLAWEYGRRLARHAVLR